MKEIGVLVGHPQAVSVPKGLFRPPADFSTGLFWSLSRESSSCIMNESDVSILCFANIFS